MKIKKLNLPPLQVSSFVTSALPLTENEKEKVKGGFTYSCIPPTTCEATKEANCTQLTCFAC